MSEQTITVAIAGDHRRWTLRHRPGADGHDLIAALGRAGFRWPSIGVDGLGTIELDSSITDLHIASGSLLHAGPTHPDSPPSTAIEGVAGSVLLSPGIAVIRLEGALVAALEVASSGQVDVHNLGATDLRVDGRTLPPARHDRISNDITVGGSSFGVVAFPEPPRPPAGTSTMARPRPPRRLLSQPVPVVVPPPDPPPPAQPTLSVAMLVLPMAAGSLMALLISPAWALFSLFGPVVGLGSYGEARWRNRRTSRRQAREADARLQRFRRDLHHARQGEIQARRQGALDRDRVVQSALGGSELWAAAADPARFRLGVGRASWTPALSGDVNRTSPAARSMLSATTSLDDVPVTLDLTDGTIVGLHGAAEMVEQSVWSIAIQLAATHPPSQLALDPVEAAQAVPTWEPLRWLPHRSVAPDPDALTLRLVDCRATSLPPLDDLPHGGRSALLAIAAERAQLPPSCTVVVEVRGDGSATLEHLAAGTSTDITCLDRLSQPRATTIARLLSRWEDPAAGCNGGLPDCLTLQDVLGTQVTTAAEITRRWSQRTAQTPLCAPIGGDGEGPVVLDLDLDGPHLLVAGTTGSGKSELLRTLVAGLALAAPPSEVTFLLVDFKGGSTFDPFSDLPHTVGVVTDLDGALASRAITSLTGELRRREAFLQAAGATDLPELRRRPAADVPPRLVVIVDEFASLAAESPELLDRLVAVAQRGRSLGVHLVLATQHPGAALRDSIRANADTRVALRLVEPADSVAIIESDDAARLPHHPPGRALLRTGGRLRRFQVARAEQVSAPQWRAELALADSDESGGSPAKRSNGLAPLVRSITEAHPGATPSSTTHPRPWLPPLPLDLDLDDQRLLSATDTTADLALALLDRPEDARQDPWHWRLDDGHLAVIGGPRSGVTTTLVSVACAAARRWTSSEIMITAIGRGDGVGALLELPHCAAVVSPDDEERLERLRWLLGGADGAPEDLLHGRPRHLVLVDSTADLLAAADASGSIAALDRWSHLLTERRAGVHWVLGATRPADIPAGILARCPQRLLHRPADAFDGPTLGIRHPELSRLPAGRAVDDEGRLVQRARCSDAPVRVPIAGGDSLRPGPSVADPLPTLPPRVSRADLPGATLDPPMIRVPVARARATLLPACLTLGPGADALVCGPARSGRSATLVTLRDQLLSAGIPVWSVDHPEPDPVVALIDDADLSERPPSDLEDLLADPARSCAIVASVRSDRIRRRFGHWTTGLRDSRSGLLLQPDPEVDPELLHTRCPAPLARVLRGPSTPGRGLLVCDGHLTIVQVAQ